MKHKHIVKTNNKGFVHHIILPVVVVLGIAAMGVITLEASHAAAFQATEYEVVTGHLTSNQNPGLTTASVNVADLGTETVASLAKGQSVNLSAFHGGGGWTDESSCYSLQSPNGTGHAVITLDSAKETVTVPEIASNFGDYCISLPNSAIATAGQDGNLTVKNETNNILYVYGATTQQQCKSNC